MAIRFKLKCFVLWKMRRSIGADKQVNLILFQQIGQHRAGFMVGDFKARMNKKIG